MTAFRNLRIYQLALEGVKQVYELTHNHYLVKDYSIVDQLRRASVSVVANIAEGYGRNTNKDKAQFLTIAIGSLNEVLAFFDVIEKIYPQVTTHEARDFYIQLGKQIWRFRQLLKT
jgi:four helix bundle protein